MAVPYTAMSTLVYVAQQALADGLNAGAELVQKRARDNAPNDPATPEDDLVESIKVAPATANNLEARVYTNARHAVPQHERMDYQHPHGGGPKFLERAGVESVDEVEELIADHIRRAFGG